MFINRIGYKNSIIIAHIFIVIGIISLAILPNIISNHFLGILISVCIYAIRGGILEVLVSLIIEACPTDNKEKSISLLHSFYCFGHVGVILLSTIFFLAIGIENWNILALLWASIPIINILLFIFAPVDSLNEKGEAGMNIKELFTNKMFWLLLIMMICAGASEQAICQWSSTLAEVGLNIDKIIGDLICPMSFAISMCTSRFLYGKIGDKINLDKFMIISTILCLSSYLWIVFFPNPFLSLLGYAICGFSVSIMWPGTFSKASLVIKKDGTLMFAMLVLAVDLGCSLGPSVVGFVSNLNNDNLKVGILGAIVFPITLLICLLVRKKQNLINTILFNYGLIKPFFIFFS